MADITTIATVVTSVGTAVVVPVVLRWNDNRKEQRLAQITQSGQAGLKRVEADADFRDDLITRINTLEAQVKEQTTQLLDMTRINATLEERQRVVTERLALQDQRLSLLNEQLSKTTHERDVLQDQVVKLQSRVDELERKLGVSQLEREMLQSEIEKKNAEIERLTVMLHTIQGDM